MDCHDLAKSRNGKCLSKTYENGSKIEWQCQHGHAWTSQYRVIKRGSWCPECSYEKKRLSLEQIKKEVQQKFNGKCLSKTYKNNLQKLTWQCKHGHTWQATYGNIQNHNRWCPHCAGNAKLTLKKMQEVAHSRGGKCLSKNYKNNHTKLKWKCFAGHKWTSRPNDVLQKGHWCPHCNLSLGERACKLIFEKSFKKQFVKIRPKWLKNKYGNNLELDGYCSDLNMAFEFNGEYHNKTVFTFHDSEDLLKVKEHDLIKIKKCFDLGILLFIINEPRPFTIKNLIKEIKQKVPFKVTENIKEIELEVYKFSKIEKYNEIAKARGGKCISKKWINSLYKLEWECEFKHQWRATPNNIQQGTWCPKCAGRQKLTINDCIQTAKSRNGECLSISYKNAHQKLTWKCKYGHIWDTSYTSIKHNKSWCPKCKGRK
jgi:hypothetical protein